MRLWHPNTDGTVKGLLEVISQGSGCEHLLSISPSQILSKAPVSSTDTRHINQLVTINTESVQQNGVNTDESSPQPPTVQSVSQKTSLCNNISYKPDSERMCSQLHQYQSLVKEHTPTRTPMVNILAMKTLRGPSDRES